MLGHRAVKCSPSSLAVPLHTAFPPLQKTWWGDRKSLPREAVPLDQCRISEAEMWCTEHNQESHREHWKGDRCQQLSGTKLYIWEHIKKSAQGNKYEASSTLEHPGDSVFQEEHDLFLLCMLDNLGTGLPGPHISVWDSKSDICLPARALLWSSSA